MNNRYSAALLCMMVLALAPACKKQSVKTNTSKSTSKDVEINTMIEVDNSIVEMEEDTEDTKLIVKF